MTAVDVFNLQKEKVSEVELRDEVFDVPIKEHVVHQVILGQLCSYRSGTASSKSRSEVRGSGSKLYRQKGTGRARVGSASSPTRKGGGVAFGPTPRNYAQRVPRKVRKAAIRMALTDKVQADKLIVVDNFGLPEIKTKDFLAIMKDFDVHKALIVTHEKMEKLEKSSRNVPWVKVVRYQGLNTYDILKYDYLFLEQSAIGEIEEALIS